MEKYNQSTSIVWSSTLPYRHLGLRLRHGTYCKGTCRTLFGLWEFQISTCECSRCSARNFDTQLRKFCAEKGVSYQAFGTLTANPDLLTSLPVRRLAAELLVDVEVSLYCLIHSLGNVTILNGTSSKRRMASDLHGLTKHGLWVTNAANRSLWDELLSQFKHLIEDD